MGNACYSKNQIFFNGLKIISTYEQRGTQIFFFKGGFLQMDAGRDAAADLKKSFLHQNLTQFPRHSSLRLNMY